MPDIAKVISELVDELGYSEQAIADALKSDGIDINQSSINRLKTGATSSPRFDVGMAILRLHERVSASRRRGNRSASRRRGNRSSARASA